MLVSRYFLPVLGIMALTAAQAAAAPPSPVGEWLVANGMARIKVDMCGQHVWGVISWEKTPGGQDSNNPDASKRERPTIGMPILMDLKPGDSDQWEGEVYNAENGKTYDASIKLKSPDVLQIQGCVLGFLCGGEEWTRYKPEPVVAPPSPAKGAKPPQSTGVEVCPSVAAATGIPLETLAPEQAHKTQLKGAKKPRAVH